MKTLDPNNMRLLIVSNSTGFSAIEVRCPHLKRCCILDTMGRGLDALPARTVAKSVRGLRPRFYIKGQGLGTRSAPA